MIVYSSFLDFGIFDFIAIDINLSLFFYIIVEPTSLTHPSHPLIFALYSISFEDCSGETLIHLGSSVKD